MTKRKWNRKTFQRIAVPVIGAAICLLIVCPIGGQSQDAAPAFEVASVKPAKAGASGSSNLFDDSGNFTAQNSTLKSMIQLAYEVRAFQILGGPAWLDRDAFDVVAKPKARVSNGKLNREMVQSLLVERFKLKFHRETRELPVYLLVVAKNGPKLQKSQSPLHGTHGSPGEIAGTGAETADLAFVLARRLGYTVIDKTGVSGFYDFTLTFDPNSERPSPAGDPSAFATDAGPSLFAALQEQLGLKLETSKGPVEVLVLDSAEKPGEN